MENVLSILNVHNGKSEASQSWIENYLAEPTLCAESGCASGTVSSSNDESEVLYKQDERETNEWGGGTSNFYSADVSIVQEAGPSSSFIPIGWINNEGYPSLSLEATDPGWGYLRRNGRRPATLNGNSARAGVAPVCSAKSVTPRRVARARYPAIFMVFPKGKT
jgi:hypothetical protein